jgi:hypothetical protein
MKKELNEKLKREEKVLFLAFRIPTLIHQAFFGVGGRRGVKEQAAVASLELQISLSIDNVFSMA